MDRGNPIIKRIANTPCYIANNDLLQLTLLAMVLQTAKRGAITFTNGTKDKIVK
jgi:hypothetical protein